MSDNKQSSRKPGSRGGQGSSSNTGNAEAARQGIYYLSPHHSFPLSNVEKITQGVKQHEAVLYCDWVICRSVRRIYSVRVAQPKEEFCIDACY